MKLATNIRSIKNFGYQLVFDNTKRIISINILYNNKILVKDKLSKPILETDNIAINELVESILLKYTNSGINLYVKDAKTKKSKAKFYSNIVSAKRK